MQQTQEIITNIRQLVKEDGFIYALLMMITDSVYCDVEKIQEKNFSNSLNTNEAALLLGFLIQQNINLNHPASLKALINMKQQTYKLMSDLQSSLNVFKNVDALKINDENYSIQSKNAYINNLNLIEPIFYSGTGVYDFQYVQFLLLKYKYDTDWLLKNKNFDVSSIEIKINQISAILHNKAQKLNVYDIKKVRAALIKDAQKHFSKEEYKTIIDEMDSFIEIYQYKDLFPTPFKDNMSFPYSSDNEKIIISYFCTGIIELFTINKFELNNEIGKFLDQFSIIPGNEENQFHNIGEFNRIYSNPVIKLTGDTYLCPLGFLLYQAMYEAPYYWMIKDKLYGNKAAENRGRVGEEIVYNLLSKVFGADKTFNSVKIQISKDETATDIDVLCLLGNKALCVQVKSKRLTQLSKAGDSNSLIRDFQAAVQDAYNQGLISRKHILTGQSSFIANNIPLKLPDNMNEAYILIVSTENYPSLTFQSTFMLDKQDADPAPLTLTIFDLDVITHYLKNPYEFLYYVKQRILLMDSVHASDEICILGYHILQHLHSQNNCILYIDNQYGQLVDRDYYTDKVNIPVSGYGNAIKNKAINYEFNQLCDDIKGMNVNGIEDVLFHLFDLNEATRLSLVNQIQSMKQKTLVDGKSRSSTMLPNNGDETTTFGLTLSISDNLHSLQNELLTLCQIRKYKSKCIQWIGLGLLKNSNKMVDMAIYNKDTWRYDPRLEELSKAQKISSIISPNGKKVARNDKCPCGSGLKYKKCCLQ